MRTHGKANYCQATSDLVKVFVCLLKIKSHLSEYTSTKFIRSNSPLAIWTPTHAGSEDLPSWWHLNPYPRTQHSTIANMHDCSNA